MISSHHSPHSHCSILLSGCETFILSLLDPCSQDHETAINLLSTLSEKFHNHPSESLSREILNLLYNPEEKTGKNKSNQSNQPNSFSFGSNRTRSGRKSHNNVEPTNFSKIEPYTLLQIFNFLQNHEIYHPSHVVNQPSPHPLFVNDSKKSRLFDPFLVFLYKPFFQNFEYNIECLNSFTHKAFQTNQSKEKIKESLSFIKNNSNLYSQESNNTNNNTTTNLISNNNSNNKTDNNSNKTTNIQQTLVKSFFTPKKPKIESDVSDKSNTNEINLNLNSKQIKLKPKPKPKSKQKSKKNTKNQSTIIEHKQSSLFDSNSDSTSTSTSTSTFISTSTSTILNENTVKNFIFPLEDTQSNENQHNIKEDVEMKENHIIVNNNKNKEIEIEIEKNKKDNNNDNDNDEKKKEKQNEEDTQEIEVGGEEKVEEEKEEEEEKVVEEEEEKEEEEKQKKNIENEKKSLNKYYWNLLFHLIEIINFNLSQNDEPTTTTTTTTTTTMFSSSSISTSSARRRKRYFFENDGDNEYGEREKDFKQQQQQQQQQNLIGPFLLLRFLLTTFLSHINQKYLEDIVTWNSKNFSQDHFISPIFKLISSIPSFCLQPIPSPSLSSHTSLSSSTSSSISSSPSQGSPLSQSPILPPSLSGNLLKSKSGSFTREFSLSIDEILERNDNTNNSNNAIVGGISTFIFQPLNILSIAISFLNLTLRASKAFNQEDEHFEIIARLTNRTLSPQIETFFLQNFFPEENKLKLIDHILMMDSLSIIEQNIHPNTCTFIFSSHPFQFLFLYSQRIMSYYLKLSPPIHSNYLFNIKGQYRFILCISELLHSFVKIADEISLNQNSDKYESNENTTVDWKTLSKEIKIFCERIGGLLKQPRTSNNANSQEHNEFLVKITDILQSIEFLASLINLKPY